MLDKLLRKNEIDIIPIKKLKKDKNCWGGDGIVFYLKNGKGILKQKYGHDDKQGLSCLVYDNVPLIKFHGDEYFCPTCEKLVSAGYGLDKTNDKTISKLRETINQPFVSLENSLKDLKPLLGLLPTGYYALADLELFPTDGIGNFFWTVGSNPVVNRATCYINDNGNWSTDIFPKYILPTQSPVFFNKKTTEFYRTNNNYRAIAYYLDGYLCSLLDGHHKAVSSAIEKRLLKTLVILPTTSVFMNNKLEAERGISISGEEIYEKELTTGLENIKDPSYINNMSKSEMKTYLRFKDDSFDEYKWPDEILESVQNFPGAFDLACIDLAGELSDSKIDKLMKNEKNYSKQDFYEEDNYKRKAYYLITSLFYLKHPRFKGVAFFIGKNEAFVSIWEEVYSLIAKIKNDRDVEDFFVEFLVNDEKIRPNITKIVDDYFREETN